jgi:hypothetical protein
VGACQPYFNEFIIPAVQLMLNGGYRASPQISYLNDTGNTWSNYDLLELVTMFDFQTFKANNQIILTFMDKKFHYYMPFIDPSTGEPGNFNNNFKIIVVGEK